MHDNKEPLKIPAYLSKKELRYLLSRGNQPISHKRFNNNYRELIMEALSINKDQFDSIRNFDIEQLIFIFEIPLVEKTIRSHSKLEEFQHK